MGRRPKGEGTVGQRKDGRWEAKLTVSSSGSKRQRRTFYAKTRAEATRKLRIALSKHDANLPIPGERETVRTFLAGWLTESAAPTLRPRTLASYKMIVY